jgi:hypothetical protein
MNRPRSLSGRESGKAGVEADRDGHTARSRSKKLR